MWVGAGYQAQVAGSNDQLGSVTSLSAVYGYRPALLRLDYPKPDLRFFVEAVAERTGPARHTADVAEDPGEHHSSGNDLTSRPAHSGPGGGDLVLVGPTVLMLYKAYGIEGGILFPLYQRQRQGQPEERFRVALNVTIFLWPD